MRGWVVLGLWICVCVSGWCEAPKSRFRGLPAGTKVLVRKASVKEEDQWASADPIELTEEGQVVELSVKLDDTLQFRHPHLEIVPAEYKVQDRITPGQPVRDIPPKLGASFELRLKPGFSHWVWYATAFKPQLGALVLLILVGGGGGGLFLFRASKARRAQQDWDLKREALIAHSDGADPLVGSILGDRYLIVDVLGQGGMATVYRAVPSESLEQSEMVAIKVIQKQFAQDREFQARFKREVLVSKGLTHPNIVRVEDWGEHEQMLYLVLEFVNGESLDRAIPRNGWKLEEAMPTLSSVLAAMIYAHEQGVVHRDIKPENIMLTRSGAPKIMDFGLARSQDVSKVTKTGSALGTPAYMPPEQITGAPPTPAADQYSLGVMFYEALTGRRPFEADDPVAVVFKQMSEEPPSPLEYKPGLNPTLAEILLRMLEKSPAARFASLEVVLEGLQAVSAGRPWEPPPKPQVSTPAPAPVKVKVTPAQGEDDEATRGFETQTMAGDDDTINFETR